MQCSLTGGRQALLWASGLVSALRSRSWGRCQPLPSASGAAAGAVGAACASSWGPVESPPDLWMWPCRCVCSDRDFVLFVCLFSDGPICRICHEGGNGEGLLSPCDCTGTLGTVHKSCLEKWLSSSNTSYCELCHTEFVVERRPRPLTEVLLSSCFTLFPYRLMKNELICPAAPVVLSPPPCSTTHKELFVQRDRVFYQTSDIAVKMQ